MRKPPIQTRLVRLDCAQLRAAEHLLRELRKASPGITNIQHRNRGLEPTSPMEIRRGRTCAIKAGNSGADYATKNAYADSIFTQMLEKKCLYDNGTYAKNVAPTHQDFTPTKS